MPTTSQSRGVPRALASVVFTLAALASGGCGQASTPRTTVDVASSLGPSTCALTEPASLAPQQWPPARVQLAPPGASTIRLCRYGGLNAHPRLALVASRLISTPSLVAQLVGEFDRLPAPPSGPVACPADDGSEITALLAYRDGHEVTIAIGLTGCLAVSNGSVGRTAAGTGTPPAFGPQLVAQLERLVGAHRGAGPGSATTLAHGHWSALARSPLGARFDPVLVWDGSALLEIGGSTGGTGGGPPSHGAAAYDPATRRWRRLASVPAAVTPDFAASVWTGRRVFVFGEPNPRERTANVAGLYDPVTNRWTVAPKAPVGPPANTPTAIWTGSRVILSVMTNRTPALEIAAYDPASNTWTKLPPPIDPHHPPMDAAMVSTNNGVLLWSLWGRTQRVGPRTFTGYSGVDVFRLGPTGDWTSVTGSWPQHHTVDTPIFTGATILVAAGQIWCGACSHPAPSGEHGYLVDPVSLHITPIPHGPLDDIGPQIIWTGAAEISFNTSGKITGPHISVLPGDIAVWNPTTFRWARGPRAPKQVSDAPAVWSGTSLLALAGDGTLLAYGP